MTVKQAIEKMYPEFLRYTNTKSNGQMFDAREPVDVLNNVMLTAMRKFGDGEYTEEELMDYLRLNLVRELQVLPKKGDKRIVKIGDLRREGEE